VLPPLPSFTKLAGSPFALSPSRAEIGIESKKRIRYSIGRVSVASYKLGHGGFKGLAPVLRTARLGDHQGMEIARLVFHESIGVSSAQSYCLLAAI
jgi:hypothetical protein